MRKEVVDAWLLKNPGCRFVKRVWIDVGRKEGERKVKEFESDLKKEAKKKMKKCESQDSNLAEIGPADPERPMARAASLAARVLPTLNPLEELGANHRVEGAATEAKKSSLVIPGNSERGAFAARDATKSVLDPDSDVEGWDEAEDLIDHRCLLRIYQHIEQECSNDNLMVVPEVDRDSGVGGRTGGGRGCGRFGGGRAGGRFGAGRGRLGRFEGRGRAVERRSRGHARLALAGRHLGIRAIGSNGKLPRAPQWKTREGAQLQQAQTVVLIMLSRS
jgi:hypothetical protein